MSNGDVSRIDKQSLERLMTAHTVLRGFVVRRCAARDYRQGRSIFGGTCSYRWRKRLSRETVRG
jgi:hypothetical protein